MRRGRSLGLVGGLWGPVPAGALWHRGQAPTVGFRLERMGSPHLVWARAQASPHCPDPCGEGSHVPALGSGS